MTYFPQRDFYEGTNSHLFTFVFLKYNLPCQEKILSILEKHLIIDTVL